MQLTVFESATAQPDSPPGYNKWRHNKMWFRATLEGCVMKFVKAATAATAAAVGVGLGYSGALIPYGILIDD